MPSLIETYARSTGLKIGKIFVREDFFALPFEKYIILTTGSGQGAKNYDLYQEVVNMLLPVLSKYGIGIVLLGDKNDPQVSGVHDLRGMTSIPQSCFLIKKSLLRVGNDSWTSHYSSAFDIPNVTLFGSTDKYIHGPFFKNENKIILLESHRRGNKPSFSSQEFPKTINFIPPEQVCNSVFSLLGIEDRLNIRTLNIGQIYHLPIIEVVPNMVVDPNFNPALPLTVRMDLNHDENMLLGILNTGRKIHLVANKPILNLNIINHFKNNILSYSHELDISCPIDYTRIIKSIISNSIFFTRKSEEQEISALRFNFIDYTTIECVPFRTKNDFFNESSIYLNKTLDNIDNLGKLFFKTNRYVLSDSKIYASHAHRLANIPAQNNGFHEIIDNEDFWKDSQHYLIFHSTQ